MAVYPRGVDLRRFLQEDPGGSVVMLDLPRFAEGGRESYARYSTALSETFLARYGGEVLYAGRGVEPHGRRPRVPAVHALPDRGTAPVLQATTPWVHG